MSLSGMGSPLPQLADGTSSSCRVHQARHFFPCLAAETRPCVALVPSPRSSTSFRDPVKQLGEGVLFGAHHVSSSRAAPSSKGLVGAYLCP